MIQLSDALTLTHKGKVRDSYRLTATLLDSPLRLVYVSDRISIFDFVLGFEIPQKGEVLAAMNAFWRRTLLDNLEEEVGFMVESDVVAAGRHIDQYLPTHMRSKDFWKRATVVREVKMLPYEAIVRGYLTGSGYDAYQETGKVCGHTLPKGLRNGEKLEKSLFTPTTKAKVGHDEHMTYQVVDRRDKRVHKAALALYEAMAAHARSRGLIMVDTKMEFGTRKFLRGNLLILADEIGTPDSSRFWREQDYATAFPASLPQAFDKQFVREWGKKHGLNDPKRFDPKNREHVRNAKGIPAPKHVIDDTRDLYLSVPVMLTGMTLKQCQKEFFGC